jgi:hypothetical protein
MRKRNEASDEELEQAYVIMAKIIRDHGEKYLPIFKRLDEERKSRQTNRDLTLVALQVAQRAV